MTQNEETAFASAEWMAIPFEVHPKMIFDQLIDILFAVQKCLLVANKLIRTVDEDATELMTDLDELIQDAMLQIHGWWIGFISSGGFRDATGKKTFGFETNPDLWCGLKEPLLPYTNIPEAALSSLYDAANVIILRLLHLVSASAAFYNLRVQNHAQSILSANHFINATSGPAPDRGSTMMVLQLKVASLWSSSSKQRDMAIAMLHGEKVQAGGLSDISSPSDEYFADVAAHILLHYPSE